MTPIRPPDPFVVGRAALAKGKWKDAKRAFQSAIARDEPNVQPEALEGLGLAAWWLDLPDLVFESREARVSSVSSASRPRVGGAGCRLARLGLGRVSRRGRGRQRMARTRATSARRPAHLPRTCLARRA